MGKTIILTENQLHQILNGVNENENKVKTLQQKISQGLLQEFQLKLNNYLETKKQNDLDNFANVLLIVMCKLSNKQYADDIITTQAVKFINKLNNLPSLQDNDKLKTAVTQNDTNTIMGYITQMLKHAQADVYREEQKYNIQSIDNEDTKYLENTISQQGGGTKINFDPIHFLEFLINYNVSPLNKSPKQKTFVWCLYRIIKNNNQTNVDLFDNKQRKVWMKSLYDIYKQNISKKTNTVFVPYEDLKTQPLTSDSKKLYHMLLKHFATIFGKGTSGRGTSGSIEKGEDYKPNLQGKFKIYYDAYQKYLETQQHQNNDISDEIDNMFNDYQ
jgi:hypothetical protein